MTRRQFALGALAASSVGPTAVDASCPLIDHLACKLPGELEPRIYDVPWASGGGLTPVALNLGFFPQQFVEIGNRDAPWHLASGGVVQTAGTATLSVRVYNSRGFGISDDVIRAGHQFGGVNAAKPFNPSLVWPQNSSLEFDVTIGGAGTFTGFLLFFGFKVYDRGKSPC